MSFKNEQPLYYDSLVSLGWVEENAPTPHLFNTITGHTLPREDVITLSFNEGYESAKNGEGQIFNGYYSNRIKLFFEQYQKFGFSAGAIQRANLIINRHAQVELSLDMMPDNKGVLPQTLPTGSPARYLLTYTLSPINREMKPMELTFAAQPSVYVPLFNGPVESPTQREERISKWVRTTNLSREQWETKNKNGTLNERGIIHCHATGTEELFEEVKKDILS